MSPQWLSELRQQKEEEEEEEDEEDEGEEEEGKNLPIITNLREAILALSHYQFHS